MKSHSAISNDMSDSSVQMRWMIRRDITDVLRIESTVCESPWFEEDILDALRQRNVVGKVVVDDHERVLGFIVYELRQRHLSVSRLAVAQHAQRRGIGRMLVDGIKQRLATTLRTRIRAVVPDRYLDLHLFLRALGFIARGVIKEGERGPRGGRLEGDCYEFVFERNRVESLV